MEGFQKRPARLNPAGRHQNTFVGKRRLKSASLPYSFTATWPSTVLMVCATA